MATTHVELLAETQRRTFRLKNVPITVLDDVQRAARDFTAQVRDEHNRIASDRLLTFDGKTASRVALARKTLAAVELGRTQAKRA
jgi:hypothetical protein